MSDFRDKVRPVPYQPGDSLADKVRALAGAEMNGGARSWPELAAWCRALGRDAEDVDRELADLRAFRADARRLQDPSNPLGHLPSATEEQFAMLSKAHERIAARERELLAAEQLLAPLLDLEREIVATCVAAGWLPSTPTPAPPPTAAIAALLRSKRA